MIWTFWCAFPISLILVLDFTKATKSLRNKRTIIGYYPLCPRGCASCSSINGCVTCKPRYYLYLHREGLRQKGVCLHSCPLGYYGLRQKDFSQCLRCGKSNCEACFNKNYCTRCKAPYLAYRGECIEHCPKGLYYANYIKDCQDKVNCETSPWTSWGVCMRNGQTCGYKYGIQTRSRDIVQVPSPNGNKCPSSSETQRCRLKYRSCVDLLHNSSDPLVIHSTDIKYWRRKRNKLRRKYRRRRKQRKLKKLLKRQRKSKIEPTFPDVSTNQITSVLPTQ